MHIQFGLVYQIYLPFGIWHEGIVVRKFVIKIW
jgi:hypothetical protein